MAPRTAFALDLILNEALINIISYGYEDDDIHRISVRLEYSATAVVADIADDGRPFNPLRAASLQDAPDLKSAAVGGAAYIRSAAIATN